MVTDDPQSPPRTFRRFLLPARRSLGLREPALAVGQATRQGDAWRKTWIVVVHHGPLCLRAMVNKMF